MSRWGRAIARTANLLRVGWLGAQVLAFVLVDKGYGGTYCFGGPTDSWLDPLAFGFLKVVTFPLTLLPSSVYTVAGPLVDLVRITFPGLTLHLFAAVFLATNYQLGVIALALVTSPARRTIARCGVHAALLDESIAMEEELRAPVTDAEWSAYHAIRRRVLFELRGSGSSYDPNHPDEHRPGHYPFLLWIADQPVGVIRVDINDAVATFRRVAIREDLQRRGYGRRLLQAAERFAKRQGCVRVESYVDPTAVPFYARCGFTAVSSPSSSTASPLMTKSIA